MNIRQFAAALASQEYYQQGKSGPQKGTRSPESDAAAARLLEGNRVHLFVSCIKGYWENYESFGAHVQRAHAKSQNFRSPAMALSSARFARNAALSEIDDATYLIGGNDYRDVCASLAALAPEGLKFSETKVAEGKKEWEQAVSQVRVVTSETHSPIGRGFRRFAKWERSAINKAQHTAAGLGLDAVMQATVKTDSKNCPNQVRWFVAQPL